MTEHTRKPKTFRQRLAERIDPERTRPSVVIRPHVRSVGGAKVMPDNGLLGGFYPFVQAPPRPEEEWRMHALDTSTLSQVSPDKLMTYLADLSPEVSKALWDFLRMINPGYEIKVLTKPDGRSYGKGQTALDGFLTQLGEYHGTLDVLFGKFFMAAWMRGAFFSELVLDEKGRTPIDLADPDPAVVRFRRELHPLRGLTWELGQYQNSEWVSLDDPGIRYVPVDPLPGQPPYGRALMSPALFASMFLLTLLHDLRRVVAQQGYPRLDLEIDLERLLESMPDDVRDDPERLQAWVQEAIDQISEMYASLEPDDAYVHTDVVKVNAPVGAINAQGLGALEGLIRGVERMAIRALKTMPIFMGSNEAVAETHAKWQWEIMAAGIRSLQHLCENMLSYQFGLALRVQGINAYVEVRFAELNELTRRHRAETEAIEIGNAARKRDEGWISQDQAAQAVTGQDAVAEAPGVSFQYSGGSGQSSVGGSRGEGGGSRRSEVGGRGSAVGRGAPLRSPTRDGEGDEALRLAQDDVELIVDDEPMPEVPDEVVFDEDDIDRVSALWDEVMADFDVEGLLEAGVEEEEERGRGGEGAKGGGGRGEGARGRRGGGETRAEALRQAQDEGPRWVWEARARRYRDTKTGRFIDHDTLDRYRDIFVSRQYEKADELIERLYNQEISVQRWQREMRLLVKDTYGAQYMAARGGRNAMTQADWGRLGPMCRAQYKFMRDFGDDLAAGKISEAEALRRARMYIESSTHPFEEGKRVSWGVPDHKLEQFPGDGNTECSVNCRCSWRFREFADRWECTWVLDPAAKHCDDCLANASKWSPLVINKVDVQ